MNPFSPLKLFIVLSTFFVSSAYILNIMFPHRFEWQGESSYFENSLDINKDGEVGRMEWEVLERGTSILEYGSSQRQFDRVDCNQNGRLSWSEYFRRTFISEICSKIGFLENITSDAPLYQANMNFPVLYTEEQLEAFKVYDPISALLTVAKSYPSEIFEEEIHWVNKVELECSAPIQSQSIKYSIPDFEVQSAVLCDIENKFEVSIITLIVLSISYKKENEEYTTLHAKPVYILPNTLNTFAVSFPELTEKAEIRLLSSRGMGQNRQRLNRDIH